MHNITLTDGSQLDINDGWTEFASSSYGSLHGGAYLIARLTAYRHGDGRVLACLTEQVGIKIRTFAQLSSAGAADLLALVMELVEERELPRTLATDCAACCAQVQIA